MRFRAEGRLARLPCPFHDENTPSAVLRVGAEGTLQLRCHGACQRSWDALTLVAHARGLDVECDHVEVLLEACTLAGLHQLEGEIRSSEGRGPAPPPRYAPPPPAPAVRELAQQRGYPPEAEVKALWAAARPLVDYAPDGPDRTKTVGADRRVYAMLRSRALSPEAVTDLDLARVLTPGAPLPRWARFKGEHPASKPWPELGFRLVLPVYDAKGAMRSVRAWRVTEPAYKGEPKRLPPYDFAVKGLALACPVAQRMLAEGRAPAWWPEGEPMGVVLCEGEPDFLTVATSYHDAHPRPDAVLGIPGSGSWSEALAARIPDGAWVYVHTHHDGPGDGYAAEAYAMLRGRCRLMRGEPMGGRP